MSKCTNIPSEIRNFFSEKRRNIVFQAFSKLVEGLHITSKDLGGNKRENCQLTNLQLFQIVIMMPFFAVKNFSHYPSSAISKMFGGKKDVLYDFMSQDNIDWRHIVYRIASKLISDVVIRKDYKKSTLPSVLIADDTDLPKSGFKMEMIGKIFSHVNQKCILGYKALMLCWSDGRTQFMLDSSLHGEKGAIEGKEQGLTSKQREQRYTRERDEKSHVSLRKNEYFMGKGQKLIEMVKKAIRSHIPFEYLLVDSWFTCTELVDTVCHLKKKFHLLGMAKLGNTKYGTKDWGNISAKAILSKLKSSKSICRCRHYRCSYATVDVTLGKNRVRLFFCKRGKNEKWRVILTTNTELSFARAYEVYSMRWAIEVFFADSKACLGLSKCSAQDFSSQIAHLSMVMIRYNLLASIKRSHDYETIGALFNEIYIGVHELTVVEKIWAIILEVVAVIAESIGANEDDMIMQVIENNKRLRALQAYAKSA
jgi:hypothetical protein